MFERNVLLIVATGFVGALTYFVKEEKDHDWQIKHPRFYSAAKRVLIPSYVLLFLTSIIFTVIDNKENNIEKEGLKKDLDSTKLISRQIKGKADSIQLNLSIVKRFAEKTDSTLSPFLSFAVRKYPKLDTIRALQKLYQEITINIKSQSIIAPNAQIATIGQTGNNYIISTIPEVAVSGRWSSINRSVDSVATKIPRKVEKLPTKRFPYDHLYVHEFEMTYSSPVMRNRGIFVVDDNNLFIDIDIKHLGKTMSGKGRISNPGKYLGQFYVSLSQPEDGKYTFTFYSTKKLVSVPVIEVIN